MAKKNPNPLAYESSKIAGYFILRDPKTLNEAIAIVGESLRALEALARGMRGDVRPETRKAFKMVVAAARQSGKDVAVRPLLPSRAGRLLEHEDVAKADELAERNGISRVDVLRLACHIGLETIDKITSDPASLSNSSLGSLPKRPRTVARGR